MSSPAALAPEAPSKPAWGALGSGLVLGGALVLMLSCGGGGGGGSTPPETFGLESRVPLTGLSFPDTTPDPSAVGLQNAYPALNFTGFPVFITSARSPDGQDWMYVATLEGRVWVFPNDPAVQEATVFLDIRALVRSPLSTGTSEEGLIGLAFDPDYETNGLFYVHYSADSPRRSVFARYRASVPAGRPPVADGTPPLVFLEVNQPFNNHNAGMIAFGPDDMLYIALGDGGSGNDPGNRSQDLGSLLGSMLRLDMRGATAAQPYQVPPDNPFLGVAGARPEAWAYGLRNPWRFSFDRDTGELWLGDVGQGSREEVHKVARGDNCGWRVYEGHRSNINPTNLPPSAFAEPIHDYDRTLGTIVMGGVVYRGQDVPTLSGSYVFGDHGSGRLFALVEGQDGSVSVTEIGNLSQVTHFGEDERGEVLLVSLAGTIHRFTEPAGTPPPAFPATLSATGLFDDVGSLTPNRGLIEYEVNAPLWSDDARKRRWIGVPGQARIGFAPEAPWTFPVGTVLVKHFELDLQVGNPGSARRLETRVLLHQRDGWAGYTYRWRADGSDADLLPGQETDTFTIDDPDAPGGQRQQTWTYPSRTDCLQCHTPAAGRILGVRTEQLNRDFPYAAQTDNQIRAWAHIGLLDVTPAHHSLLPAWPDPADGTADLDARARAYLAANCAQCHLPGGPAPGGMDLRFLTPQAQMDVIDVVPNQGDLGIAGARIVDPGSPGTSVLWERMRRTDTTRMPRLGSHLVDDAGVTLLEAWILSR